MGLLIGNDEGIDGGGFCPNSTVYCSFGCCGDLEKQLCCFPIGVIIGCGFGALGTICLLISIFRCRMGKQRPHPQTNADYRSGGPPSTGFVTGYGHHVAYANPESSFQSVYAVPTVTGIGPLENPKYTMYTLPPSYETAIASAAQSMTRNDSVDIDTTHTQGNNSDSVDHIPARVGGEVTGPGTEAELRIPDDHSRANDKDSAISCHKAVDQNVLSS